MTVLRAARVFTGEQEFSPGEVVLAGDRIVGVGPAVAGRAVDVDLGDATLAPGFVDAHCHGAAGRAFSEDPDAVLAFHRAHGTTSMIASLVSEPLDILHEQIARLAPLVRDGSLAGIHLEGPWLAAAYKGAHAEEHLRDPDPAEVRAALDAGAGTVRMVTVAAERPGGPAAIALLRERGVVAALGHTAANHAVAVAAIDAGVTGATHLFNAMPPLHHRDPGPVLALLNDPRVWLEVIQDGVHLSPDLVAWLFDVCPKRLVLISDAMAATGCCDGAYRIGSLPVEVRNGIALLAGTDTLAGSTLTLDVALGHAVAAGVDWRAAVRSLTVQPARYLGLTDVGELRPGAKADLVALDGDWQVTGVWHRGRHVDTHPGLGSVTATR
ncbi:N-acetylglucosamine-6-phosphate deacetylase [Granulicoccus sp. GXG6511]|uniref:N-acetylglucosamine-6-phosphate deacetylase n=1 Tax=Granulicoccus sp. GXG6511 TaxID=3381351 RepID=UPI003D7E2F1F